MGDLIRHLPVDKVPPSLPERECISIIFGSHQDRNASAKKGNWKKVFEEFRFVFTAAFFFFLFQWSTFRDFLKNYGPTLIQKSSFFQYLLNTIFFSILVWFFYNLRINIIQTTKTS